ncbi:YhcH/YjgK/YiaL family protein [Segetibacter sp. 3557_3]|uniref:YhcH/YjgK/YiaL family protein n=1 Tax=Segetibacter sp. 3557_3 TaxID=2547429 RepID=UPI001404F38D|nr:YhcH/YjgK/YiaL family protein [Segetibacter sp. 3557_3]
MLIAALVSFQAGARQTDSTRLSSKQSNRWFNKKAWLQSAPLKPHQTINKAEFARQYHLNRAVWDKAFAFLSQQNLQTLAKGRHPIDGDLVYASVTVDSSKNFEKTSWESHQNYIDVQCIITGVEKMGVVPVREATVTKPYDQKRDVANYSATGKIYTGEPGTFFIFFPGDAHRPNITPGGNKPVRKVVIKVKAVP